MESGKQLVQAPEPFLPHDLHLHVGVDLLQRFTGDLRLGAPQRPGGGEDLAVQVAGLEGVHVRHRQVSRPGPHQALQRGAPHSPGPQDQDSGAAETSLISRGEEARVPVRELFVRDVHGRGPHET